MADDFMGNGGVVPALAPGCTGFSAALWPTTPSEPREVRFSADWPGITLVCLRSLDGYSPYGGLHREPCTVPAEELH